MAVVYITKPGVKVHLEGNHLLVKGEDFKQTIYTFNLERLILVGKVELTYSALTHLLRNNTSVIFLTRQGNYLGSLSGLEAKNVFLRVSQYERLQDPEFKLNTARSIVSGKIRNMRMLIMRMARTLDSNLCSDVAKNLARFSSLVQSASSVESLRGFEGQATKIYFKGLKEGFDPDLGFTKRTRRPPTDPVNACLSFGYTILMNIVAGAIGARGLDPALGNLHELSYGRLSLALDLMEEFRVPVVDMTVLACFNLGILQKDDFYTVEPQKKSDFSENGKWVEEIDILISGRDTYEQIKGAENEDAEGPGEDDAGVIGVFLKKEAKKRFLTRLEKRLSMTLYYPRLDKKLTLRQIIDRQIELYSFYIRGEVPLYDPISPK
ncbi:MAG: CRISPR-associated endonuclease Cas1 [Desulfonauticus sp.]|nr:CRISPR-associated endonuclease Cas1 [Desulfonauticus sp.]